MIHINDIGIKRNVLLLFLFLILFFVCLFVFYQPSRVQMGFSPSHTVQTRLPFIFVSDSTSSTPVGNDDEKVHLITNTVVRMRTFELHYIC